MKLKTALFLTLTCHLFAQVSIAGVVGFYTFDDPAAPFTDDSGSGNALQSADADPSYVSDGGVDGGAFEFDGSQRLVIPIDINPGTVPQLTVGAWVKTSTSGAPGLYKVMGHDNGGWDRTIGLDNREGDFRYTAFVGNRRPVVDTPGPVNDDDWTFFAATFDQPNNEVTVYVDLDSSSSADPLLAVTEPTAFADGLATLSLGSLRPDAPNEGWIGFIDNAFVFDEVLDAGQLTQIRNGGKDAVTADLAANDPAIALAGGEALFGRLPSNPGRQERPVAVGNGGAANDLTFTSVTITGDQASFYEIVSVPDMIGPGTTGDIVVAFDPGNESGDFIATLVIESNDAAVPIVTVDLSAKVAAVSFSGSLLGFYTFDDADNPLADGSGRGNNLQEPGGAENPTYGAAAGIQGGAYTYDGSQRLIAPININPGEVPELTVGAWVKTSSLDPGLRKVLGGDNGGWDRTIGLDNREGDFRYTAFVGNQRPVVGTPGPESVDAWTFLAVTFDQPNNEVTVFVDTDVSSLDDDLVAVTEPTGFGDGFDTVAIGGLRPDNGAEGWAGEIDNVFLVPGILSLEQLDRFRAGGRSAIESFGFGPPRENLVAFWNFDEPAMPAADASGNGKDLDDQVAPPTYVPGGGFEGGAYDFDGGQRLVADVDINPEELPEMTWGAWVKPSSIAPGLRKVMGHDDGGWDRTIGLDNREGDFRYTAFVGNQRPVVDTPGPENTEDWTFLAVVYDEPNAEVTVFVDVDAGSIGDELVAVSEPTEFNTGQSQFSIGSLRPDNAAEGWAGLIDNAFLYNTKLTPAQLAFMRDGGSGTIIPTNDDPDFVFTRDPAFGDLGTRNAVTRSLAVQNGGRSQNLTFTSVTVEGPDAAFYSIDTFPDMLAPGAAGTIDLTFNPRGEVGKFTAALRVESTDTSQPVTILNLQASTPAPAVDDPVLSGPLISPFGTLTPGVHERTIAIKNVGTANDLSISSIAVKGPEAANYTVGDLPGPIAPGGSGDLVITFDSEGEFGRFRAALTITSTNAVDRFSSIDISGVVPIGDPLDALIAFYSFDDPANPLKDDAEEGNTLEIPEDAEPTYMANGGVDDSGVFHFDGSQRLVADIDINVSEIPELTLGAWVKPENIDPGLRKIIGHDNGGWDRTIGLDNREDDLRYTAFIGNGRPVLGTPGPENTDDWTFIAVGYDQPNNEVTVYVDIDSSTTEDELVAVSEPTSFNSGWPTLSIGSLRPDNNSEGWVGLIDRAFFFDALLDPATIRDLRDGGILPGSEDPNLRLSGGFGELPNGAGMVTREITVRNGGRDNTLTISASRITGPDAASFTLNGEFPASLPPGESATVSVTLNPAGRTGGFVAFLEIDSNDPGDPTERLDLSALIPINSALLAHYKFDDTAGVTMLDSSGRGAHGSYLAANGGSFTLGEAALASGTAVRFDDAGDSGAGYGEVAASAKIPELTNFSVSMWINQAADDTGVSALFAKGTGAGDPFAVAVVGDALVWFSGGTQTLTVEGAFTPGEAAHILTTFETIEGEPTAAFYVNGVEVGREANVEPFSDAQSSIFQIGALNGGFGFKGVIDDVQLFSAALDVEDAMFLFNNPGQVVPGEDIIVEPMPLGPIGPVSISENGFSLTLPAGEALDVEYSEDLINWDIIANGVTGVFEDTDPGRRASSDGFYRGRQN